MAMETLRARSEPARESPLEPFLSELADLAAAKESQKVSRGGVKRAGLGGGGMGPSGSIPRGSSMAQRASPRDTGPTMPAKSFLPPRLC